MKRSPKKPARRNPYEVLRTSTSILVILSSFFLINVEAKKVNPANEKERALRYFANSISPDISSLLNISKKPKKRYTDKKRTMQIKI